MKLTFLNKLALRHRETEVYFGDVFSLSAVMVLLTDQSCWIKTDSYKKHDTYFIEKIKTYLKRSKRTGLSILFSRIMTGNALGNNPLNFFKRFFTKGPLKTPNRIG